MRLHSDRSELTRPLALLDVLARLVAAGILGQTLFFKFSGAAEARHVFGQLGAEPWGRWATGIVELAAVVLLLWPRSAAWGALLAGGLMLGAIGSHLTVLGIVVLEDGGTLFALACAALAASAAVLWARRSCLAPALARVVGRTPAGRG